MDSVFTNYFYPESICVVGASSKPKSLGYELTKSIKQYGYTGKLILINPKSDEVLGYKCYPSIEAAKEKIDLAIIMVPKQFVSESIKQLTDKETKALILITAGLSGCASTAGVGPSSSSWISVSIENTTRSAVDQAVMDVFRRDGFTLVSRSPYGFSFRKWGGRSTEIMYGSWFTKGVAAEPQITVTNPSAGTYRVHCDVFMREPHRGTLSGSEHQLRAVGRSAYLGLLEQVKQQARGRTR